MWIAIMEKEHDSWHGWHPWNPTWDFTDVLSGGHGQAETRPRVVKRVLFRTGHVKQILMGFLGQTGLICSPCESHGMWIKCTWSMLQEMCKPVQLQELFKTFFGHKPTTTNFRWPRPTPVLKAQGTSASPHGCCHWVAHLTMDWFKSLEPNDPHICSHWDDS